MSEPTLSVARSLESQLAGAVDEFMAEIHRGHHPSIDDFATRYPEIADELRRVLPALAMLGSSEPHAHLAGPDAEDGTLGDFRLIREVGRGGMGIVYEAEQISLCRKVALKVLPFAATMDPRQLQRFRNEAQAAACLHHPNIVPVHGVGVDRGVHYYAMQLIEGQTLAEVIAASRAQVFSSRERERPESSLETPVADAPGSTKTFALLSTKRDKTHFRHIASLIASAADALEYAHSMGVLHRDIKPGNLMLDFSPSPLCGGGLGWGAGGHLWITDFGLAKVVASLRDAEPGCGATRLLPDLTLTGDMIGTLRYMSPEAALAKHGLVDHRTDIYSLGATLYELLTLKPAVDGADKAEMLKRIAWDDPTPLRKHDKSIPAELETITLKCLAKEPGERYATAGELAADLRRWLGDQTIKAKPPGIKQKVGKWMGRHRAVVTVTVLALLACVAVLGVGIIRERNIAEEEARQRQRAHANMRLALDALEVTARPLIESLTVRPIARTPAERDAIQRMLVFYEEFDRKNSDDPALRLECSKARMRAGQIYTNLKDHERAIEASRAALAVADAMLAEQPDDPAVVRHRVLVLCKVGQSTYSAERFSGAEPVLNETAAAAERLLVNSPSDRELLECIAYAENLLGAIAFRAGRAGAEALFRRSVEFGERWLACSPSEAHPIGAVALMIHNVGSALEKQGRNEDAIEFLSRAVDLERKAVHLDPGDLTWRLSLRNSIHQLVAVKERLKHPREEIVAGTVEQVAHMERLIEADPGCEEFRFDLALDLSSQVRLSEPNYGNETILSFQRRSTALYDGLVAQFPDNSLYRQKRDNGLVWESKILFQLGREAEALAAAERIAEEHPLEYEVAAFDRAQIRLIAKDNTLRNAAEALRITSWAIQLPASAARPMIQSIWPDLHALAQYRSGEYAAALATLDRAGNQETPGSLQKYLRALVYWQTGERNKALDVCKQAIEKRKRERSHRALDVLHAEAITAMGIKESDPEAVKTAATPDK